MMTKFMNKQRGLLAAIMALVMVFAGAAFVAAEVDADAVADTKSPLSFTGDVNYGDPYGSTSNTALGNDIKVTYADTTKTYTVTGALAKQIYDAGAPTTFSKLYGGNFGNDAYGIAFNVTGTEGTDIKVGNGSGEIPANGTEACLMYLDGTDENFEVTVGTIKYTVELDVEYCTVLNAAEGTISETGGSYIIDGPNNTVTFTNGIKVTGDLLIHVPAGQKLVVNGYGICGSKDKVVNLTLAGNGEVIINASTGNDLTTAFSSAGIAGFNDIKIEVGKLKINATGDKSAGITGKNADGGSGALTIDGTVADITGSNRGIYVSSVTIQNGAKVTASGYERGITYGSSGTITVDGANTELEGKLLTKVSGETEGENDRMGLKIGTLSITNGATVKAQAAHISSSASIDGTLEIIYNKDAGRGADTTKSISAVPAGLILATEDNEPSTTKGENVVSLTITGGKLIVDAGNAILGTIKTSNDDYATFGTITTEGLNVLKPIIASSDVTITKGSINISGSFETDATTGDITITGDVTISGTVDENITINAENATKITVPADGLVLNGKLDFTGAATAVTVNVVGDVSGSGSIVATEAQATIKKSPTSSITATVPNDIVDVDNTGSGLAMPDYDSSTDVSITNQTDADKFESEMQKYTSVSFKDLVIPANVSLEIPSHITLDVSGTITVTGINGTDSGAQTELIVYGKVIGTGIIKVGKGANLYLDGADIRVIVDADKDAYISVTNAKKMTVKGDSTADLGVGYGNTLVLSDLKVYGGKSIDAYGTVIIEGTVTVEKGAQFNVYASGNAQIDGALVIEGIANIKGAADVNGSVKVYNADGNAAFNVAAGADVDVAGTMDVLVGKNKAQNTLTIEDVPTEDKQKGKMNFVVTGTLNITGTLDGAVYDMGTVAFNGTAVGTNAKIFIFDGMTITIASVAGTLIVTDMVDKADFIANEKASKSNSVVLKNVKNVTVSTEVTETVKEDADKNKIRYYTLNMTVSGAVTSIDDKNIAAEDAYISIENNEASAGWADAKVDDRSITIGDITAGKNVTVKIDAIEATVAGTITIAADGSNMTIEGQAVDVLGSIINVSGADNAAKIVIDSMVNASKVEVENTSASAGTITTITYTTLDAALAASAEDANKTIDVLGTSKIASDLEVPAGITVDLATGAAMTIDVDGKLTVAATALLDASAGSVKVDGMLVIMDKETGLNEPKVFTYQVLNETETTATYSGLVLALQNAVAGDVITLKQNADITKSVTIPEGVTLVIPKNVTLTVGDDKDDVTLTVAGTLKVEGSVKAATGAKKVEIAIPGVIVGADKVVETGLTMTDYVSFDMKIDGRLTHIHSNLAYAAANAVDGDVDIVGDVSGGDVTFTVADKKELEITVTNDSTLSVGTLTLVGAGASITTADAVAASGSTPAKEAGIITGTIAAAAGSVDLNKVSGIKIEVNVEETVDAKTDIMIVDDTTDGLSGSFTVASGTVTAATGFAMNASKDNKMSVASDATLLVDAVFTATGTVSGDDNYDVIIDGTISVIKNGKATIEYTTVNGTIDVASEGTLNIDSAVVNGTISVAEKTDDAAAGVANVNGALVLGAAPALGANGAFVGPVDIIDDAYIIAYAGADVSAALIDVENGESTAKSTEIVLNGVPYMTVYVDANSTLKLSALQKYFEVEGFESTVDWKDSIDGNTELVSVNKIEGTLTAAKTKLTVSAGVGLKVYIDGLAIENFYGKYDVNGTATPDDDVTGYWIQFGTHTVSFAVESGYDGSAATITVNGVAVSNNGTFTVDVDAEKITIIASGAVPAQSGSTVVVDDADDEMALTDILLIVLVVLIVIMAIIVALRMMRS